LKKLLTFLILIFVSIQSSFAVDLAEIGKVTGVYQRAKSTIVTMELEVKLPPGVIAFINKDIKAVIGDLFSNDAKVYRYEAALSGKGNVEKDAKVYIFGQKENDGTNIYLRLERRVSFEPKSTGHVIASYGSRIHIDRGSLHEVHDRDIYAIYDSSGHYKGNIEAIGVGDYETIGQTVTGERSRIEPGDNVIHLGQRKFFGLGFMYGFSLPVTDGNWAQGPSSWRKGSGIVADPLEDADWGDFEKSANISSRDGGLFWEWQFRDGWGINWMWGIYGHSSLGYNNITRNIVDSNGNKIGISTIYIKDNFSVEIISPIVLKKNFFYPDWFSPYLGIGTALYRSSFSDIQTVYYRYDDNSGTGQGVNVRNRDPKIAYATLFPVVGLQLFSSNTIHLIIDTKYFPPWRRLESNGEDHTWSGWITSLAVTTNW